MRESLDGFCSMEKGIPKISRIQDASVFVESFVVCGYCKAENA